MNALTNFPVLITERALTKARDMNVLVHNIIWEKTVKLPVFAHALLVKTQLNAFKDQLRSIAVFVRKVTLERTVKAKLTTALKKSRV
jgi:hypothetical protein